MAQPTWVTPAGTLGTIPEGVFYQTPLEAIDPALTLAATNFTYSQGQVTLSFSIQYATPFGAGSSIALTGFTPSSYNGTYTVTRGTQTSVSFVHSNDGVPTELGVISNTAKTVYYELIAGKLPSGIQIDQSGLLSGVPQALVNIQGVPSQVSSDVTSTFAIRAYTTKLIGTSTVVDRLADQTFNITVTGQDAPEFITPAGQIAEYYDGTAVPGIQILYTDVDPDDSVTIRLISGELPLGLAVSAKGLISGFIEPNATNDQTAGYSRDGQGYDEYPYDFATRSTSKNFEFTLEVTDGKTGGSNLRTFSIFIVSRSSLTADTNDSTFDKQTQSWYGGFFTADNTFITADETPVRVPIILNTQGSIGNVRNDNFYAYQFNGLDLDGDQIRYIANTTPPGLTLNNVTGWLSGYIPNLGLTDQTYNFDVQAYKANDPTVISDPYNYSLEIVGPIDTDLRWLTPASETERARVPSSLGTINNGATSTIYVQATNKAGLSLQYKLVSGSDSNLPQGLQLLPSGDIAGRVSFDTFALDGGATTFDVGSSNIPLARRAFGTTFDMIHTFTVNAYSANNYINVTKTFSIQVIRAYNVPYENLYIQAMPPQADRDLVNNLLQNSEIFPPDLIYRSSDPNFGIATKVVYWHAYGLTASTIDDYVNALDINHYWKNLVLGEIKTARALDANGETIYEVVYSEVIDNLVNNDGVSVGKEVVLPYTVQDFGYNDTNVVYPNALVDMRQQVIDTVGQVNNVLPRWMLSKQRDGRILGFTPAWVLCYAKAGAGDQIAYNIKTQFGAKLNLVDFEVDRYELDRLLTHNWDPATDSWIPTPPESTTVDIDSHYQLNNNVIPNAGNGYAVGDRIRIIGGDIGAPVLSGGSFTANTEYTINTVGSTNWISIGASAIVTMTGIIDNGAGNIGNILTVSNVANGTITADRYISGSGVTPGTYIITQLNGSNASLVANTTSTYPSMVSTIGVANATGVVAGQVISGIGIPEGTFVSDSYVSGTNIDLVDVNGDSVLTTSPATSEPVYFYTPGETGTYQVNFNQLVGTPTTIYGQPDIGTTFVSTGAGSGNGTANPTSFDAIITVNTIVGYPTPLLATGPISQVFCDFTIVANFTEAEQVFYNIPGINITGTGSGAIWNILISNNVPTVFDYNSLQFIDPSDMYSNTQEYDRYLLFPRRTILSPLPPVPPENSVVWTNYNGQPVKWVNSAGAPVNWVNSIVVWTNADQQRAGWVNDTSNEVVWTTENP